jgi:hypothetical protein
MLGVLPSCKPARRGGASSRRRGFWLRRSVRPSIVPVSPAVMAASSVASAESDAFPPSWSLMGARRIVDQASINCCVSCSIAAAAESANDSCAALSPLFHYFVTRAHVMGASPTQNINLPLEDAENSGPHFSPAFLGSFHEFALAARGESAESDRRRCGVERNFLKGRCSDFPHFPGRLAFLLITLLTAYLKLSTVPSARTTMAVFLVPRSVSS